MEEPRIGWVGHICRRLFGYRKMLPGKKFPGAVGSVEMKVSIIRWAAGAEEKPKLEDMKKTHICRTVYR